MPKLVIRDAWDPKQELGSDKANLAGSSQVTYPRTRRTLGYSTPGSSSTLPRFVNIVIPVSSRPHLSSVHCPSVTSRMLLGDVERRDSSPWGISLLCLSSSATSISQVIHTGSSSSRFKSTTIMTTPLWPSPGGESPRETSASVGDLLRDSREWRRAGSRVWGKAG